MNPDDAVCVYGAGHIGCYVGARLAAAGARVTLIGRARVVDELRRNGLGYSDYLGRRGEVPAAALQLGTGPEAAAGAALVLVCVKSGSTAEVAALLGTVLAPGTVVLSLQNGLHNAEVLARRLPACAVLAGMVPFNVVPLAPGRYHQATQGQLDARRHEALVRWQPLFARAGLALALHDDMPAVQWGKLLLNLNNPINALSGLPIRAMLHDTAFRRCMALAQQEALAILRAAGIRPARMTPLPPRWVPALLRLPDALFLRLAQRMLAIDPHARSSMADDLDKGRVSEVDFINGEIVALARRLGREAPVNARLVALMREAEAGARKVWTGPQLLARLRAG
ncbi:MAG: 2-dehydropantoate 2-reductase [Burkholderiales bacterium]|nr:2-dehydropantoate 2-reductase [Burkholderiales bacterium]